MPDKNELKIEEDDPVINGLVRLLKTPKGKIKVQLDNKPVLLFLF